MLSETKPLEERFKEVIDCVGDDVENYYDCARGYAESYK